MIHHLGRKEFPAIPGGVNEKCEPLMGVLCDTTGENNFTDILLRNNSLEVLLFNLLEDVV